MPGEPCPSRHTLTAATAIQSAGSRAWGNAPRGVLLVETAFGDTPRRPVRHCEDVAALPEPSRNRDGVAVRHPSALFRQGIEMLAIAAPQ
jgi:hypothetical protein